MSLRGCFQQRLREAVQPLVTTEWGVFSDPPTVARPNRAQKANAQLFTYGSSKAAFLHNETCVREAGEPVRQICEVGFNAGHTSLLWLEAVPTARVTAFDMGDMAYAAKQAALLKRAYGNRFEVVWGSSLETVPAHAQGFAELATWSSLTVVNQRSYA